MDEEYSFSFEAFKSFTKPKVTDSDINIDTNADSIQSATVPETLPKIQCVFTSNSELAFDDENKNNESITDISINQRTQSSSNDSQTNSKELDSNLPQSQSSPMNMIDTMADIEDIDEQTIKSTAMKECKHLQRISQILSYYHKWVKKMQLKMNINTIGISLITEEIDMNTSDSKSTSEEELGMYDCISGGKYLGYYNNSTLLNDFHHIIDYHEFESLHYHCMTSVNPMCDMFSSSKSKRNLTGNCLILHRHHRNKLEHNTHTNNNTYLGFTSINEINTQQILDIIHCFIFHSFHLGFKLTKKEKHIFRGSATLYVSILVLYDNRNTFLYFVICIL